MSIDDLYNKINSYTYVNELVGSYYEGEAYVDSLSISVPPTLKHVREVVGWPSTGVDVLEERIDFLGWDDDGVYGLEDIYDANSMDNESSLINIDTLLYGISFASVSTGFDGEPPAIITAESPLHTTGLWNKRTRRLDEGITRYRDEDGLFTKLAHYEKDKTTYYRRRSESSPWVVDRTDNHKLGRVQLVQQVNRARAGRPGGKSEITRAIRCYTDIAVRTILGMEVNREFYSAPQRYVLGAREDAFTDEQGNPIPGWRAIMGSLWQLSRDEEWSEKSDGKSDGLPTVGQFQSNPPGPYLEQVRGLGQLVCAEFGMPPSYLGFSTDNPPSADSIRALEARLVKRAERRQSAWSPSYAEIGQLAALVSTGKLPDRSEIRINWRDAATPTKSADADRAIKLVGAGIIPANSKIAYEMAGLTPRQIKQLVGSDFTGPVPVEESPAPGEIREGEIN